MIQKPEITRKLAWTAFYLEAGYILLNILLIFLFPVLPTEKLFGWEAELPFQILIWQVISECLAIPFAWSCLRSALQNEITENNTVSGLVLPSVLWFCAGLVKPVISRILTGIMYSQSVAGSVSVLNAFKGYVNIIPLHTASLVLICCASAIELYILKHKES